MIVRCELAGARIEDSIGPETTHVIAPVYMTISEAARKLDQEAVHLEWPPGIHFVSPDFVTQSLAKQRLLDQSE